MENAIVLARVMGPFFLLIGLSVLFYLKSWQYVYDKYANNHYELLPFEVLFAVLGAICVNMYNVWELNVWLLVTLTGWALVVKSVGYFLLPGSIIKKIIAMKKETWVLSLGGILGLVIGGLLTYYSYFA